MFLKEIESHPAEGMTKIAFKRLRDQGEAIPGILHLFRFKRRSTDHLVRFTEEVMRGPSPLSPGMRELIGAFFSRRNQCSFCSEAHAAAAAHYLERDLVDGVLCDVETSSLDPAHKELFRYIGKLAENPAHVTAADINKVKEAGWSEEAIYDALTVAAVFKFYNTWNNGSGVQNMTSADYLHSGKVLTTMGYCMDFKLRRLVKLTASKVIAMLRSVFTTNRNRGSEHGQALADTKSASANIGLTCEAPIFTAIETSFFKEEGLNISVRDE
ncbi:MAG TPA: hypothetical protein VFD27_18775 [Chthoniobacteraceae bacterium]|jgi:uncharacterized peroxidase-related enzyme|nr:hypothetical protein [Chthoniobacteraceae bacterium]